jgi:hypothetical protein
MDTAATHDQPKCPVAGLDPATHVFLPLISVAVQDVDARIKVRARGPERS